MNNTQIIISIVTLIVLLSIVSYFVFFNNQEEFYSKDKLVLYYTPWCGHCATVKPKWIEFKEENKFSDVEIDMVDCDSSNDVCNRLKIEIIPTIILHKKNEKIVYEGKVDIDSVKEWLVSKEYK
jgi:thioredoxin-like negative regulator of GroEL|tara:strand:+ start:361 stop:732 length:372 start_codon:yes stop_codon:yes gene_type:complete